MKKIKNLWIKMGKISIPVSLSLKSIKVIIILTLGVLALLCSIIYSVAKNAKLSSLVQAKIISQVFEVEASTSDLEQKITSLLSDINQLDETIDSDRQMYDSYIDYIAKKKTYSTDINSNMSRINALDTNIALKQSELQRLTVGQVATGQPISLGAGEHIVGDSLPAGRYKITGSSNLFIYTDDGDLLVNTILGGRLGVDSYTVNVTDGYKIESRGRDTFQPVE